MARSEAGALSLTLTRNTVLLAAVIGQAAAPKVTADNAEGAP
jgi:hypothetical protein